MSKNTEVSCAWKSKSECEGCINNKALKCRWRMSDLLLFMFITLPALLGLLAGTIIIGLTHSVWWPATAYILFFPIVLGVAETRFLCSHCPFYAQDGKVLHCLANHGFFKIWRYHPEPMNRIERAFMILLFLIFLVFIPVSVMGYNIIYFANNTAQYGNIAFALIISLTAVTIMSIIGFAFVMVKNICSACINFSCPFNRVEKRHVDSYLLRNPIMRRAWEEKGYKID